jgi:methylase of polypeptide subunit release factors
MGEELCRKVDQGSVCFLPQAPIEENACRPSEEKDSSPFCSIENPLQTILERSSSAGFQNNYALKLFSAACPVPLASTGGEIDLQNVPIDQSSPLPQFDQRDVGQNCMAQDLSAFLDVTGFDGINRAVHGKDYGRQPIYDTELMASNLEKKLAGHPEFSEAQKKAFLFFMYGKALPEKDLRELFSGQAELFSEMKSSHLIVAETQGGQALYRLNDLSLTSQKLPNGETMYLFVDLPNRLRSLQNGPEPTAQISATSYFLLNRLMTDYRIGVKRSGVVADFGAGTGIQAIALLKMYPQIQEAISLEIDKPSMNLNRLNAMMNGVADRIQVVDNADPANLKTALAGRELDLAVSNPPFNIVPHEYESQFTHFGYGGDHGIDITKIFLNQALPVLKKNGEFIYYSYLAKDAKGQFFVTQFLKENFKGLNLHYDNLDSQGYRYFDRARYAKALADFMVKEKLSSSQDPSSLAKDIESKLKEDGVHELDEKIGRIAKRGDNGPVKEIQPLDVLSKETEPLGGVYLSKITDFGQISGGERAQRIGGIYERLLKVPEHRGGVYIEQHRVPNFGQISGGEMIQRIDLGLKKLDISDLLKKDPELKAICEKNPSCAKLLKTPQKNASPSQNK